MRSSSWRNKEADLTRPFSQGACRPRNETPRARDRSSRTPRYTQAAPHSCRKDGASGCDNAGQVRKESVCTQRKQAAPWRALLLRRFSATPGNAIHCGAAMTTLIKNGTIITATDTYKADVLVKNGVVSEIGREISKIASEIIDAADKWVLPGGVDVHTHMDAQIDGMTTVDDFETGTAAAAA